MDLTERFWGASVGEMKQGYIWDGPTGHYYCLLCGEGFEKGEIFRNEASGRFYEAGKYVGFHVQQAHGSMLDYLLELDKKATGLTDLQKQLIRGFAANLSDNAMLERTGIGSASTVRNHRFVLKEKAKQAKLLLAVMELMEQGEAEAPRFMPVHATATQVDERYVITEDENASVLKQYFPDGPDGPLASFPRKEKRKIAVLRQIAARFEWGVKYGEKEVNERLKAVWAEDYVVLRRYLIEYGFMDRKDDGSEYWLKAPVAGVKKAEAPAELHAAVKPKREKQGKSVKEKKGKEGAKMDKAQRKQLTAEYQERERAMGVFQIKNNANGKIYVGGSANLESLWGREQFMLNMGSHPNKELQKEWKEYGSENFSYLVLETVKFDQQLRYDYKDVLASEGREPADMVRQYNREVAELKEQWVEKLQPYGEKGYHVEAGNSKE